MQIIDSHCHLNFEDIANNIDSVLEEAQRLNVTHMLCVAVDLENYPAVKALADSYKNIFCSVGVHPNYTEGEDPTVERLVSLGSDERVVAIGETGLDYFCNEGDLSWQRERFERHIEAANTLEKPLIIHTREAADDTMDMLKSCGAEKAGGVIHCFAEDWRIAEKALDLGFYLSFSGIVTFKSAKNVQDVAKRVPADRMLVETDSPYLAPVPHRGKTNQPGWTRHVAEYVATLRDESLERIAEQTTENFFRLFNSAKPVS